MERRIDGRALAHCDLYTREERINFLKFVCERSKGFGKRTKL